MVLTHPKSHEADSGTSDTLCESNPETYCLGGKDKDINVEWNEN